MRTLASAPYALRITGPCELIAHCHLKENKRKHKKEVISCSYLQAGKKSDDESSHQLNHFSFFLIQLLYFVTLRVKVIILSSAPNHYLSPYIVRFLLTGYIMFPILFLPVTFFLSSPKQMKFNKIHLVAIDTSKAMYTFEVL